MLSMRELKEGEVAFVSGGDNCAYVAPVGAAIGASIGGPGGSAVGAISALAACRFATAVAREPSSFGNDGSITYVAA